MKFLRRLQEWLGERPHQTVGLRVLQAAIGVALLFRVFTEGPCCRYLWGPRGLGSVTDSAGGGGFYRALAIVFGTDFGTYAVIAMLALGALGLATGTRTLLSVALAYLGLVCLEYRLPELPDGGDNVMRICLIYMLFTLPPHRSGDRGTVRVWLHNVAIVAIAFQVCVLYTTSGFQKAFGERWHTGVAIYYVTRSMWFSQPSLAPLFTNPVVATAATYGPVFHQLWFPVAILSPLRLAWIVLGILFHVGIASLMGLVTFSIVMIGLELFFVTDREYRWLSARLARGYAASRALLMARIPSRLVGRSELDPNSTS